MRITGLLKTLVLPAAFLTGASVMAQQATLQQMMTADRHQAKASNAKAAPAPRVSVEQLRASAREKVLRVGRKIRHTRLDCSHLVHDLYQRAGLRYEYINSEQLYDGSPGFRQVDEPLAGDIIVWRGHMGVIVDPLLHSFLSGLRTGVKISAYDSDYWKGRGIPRFFRYSAGDDVIDLSSQVRVARNHILRPPISGE